MANSGPDFLYIGMQRAGSRWIYDALSSTDGFQMMPRKEFHHFDMAARGKLNGRRHKERLLRSVGKTLPCTTKAQAARYAVAVEAYVKSPSHTNYKDLFVSDAGMVTGDLTPGYSILSPHKVDEIRDLLPDVKIIMSVREPRARAWSQFNMHLRGKLKRYSKDSPAKLLKRMQSLASPRRLRHFLKLERCTKRSSPTTIHKVWSQRYPDMLVLDFMRIANEPELTFRKITNYLGQPASNVPPLANRKADNIKARLLPQHQSILDNAFATEIAACRAYFPTIAAGWQ